MKVEDVKSYKQIYKDIQVPFSVAEEKWHAQRDLLGEQDTPRPSYYRYMPYAYAVAGIVLFLSVSLLTILAAQPGTSLYGMKAMTQHVYSTLSKPFSSGNNPSSLKSNAGITLSPTNIPTNHPATPTLSPHPTSREEMHESSSAVAHEHENEVKGAAVTSTPHTFSSNNNSDNHGSQSNQSQNHGSGSQNSHDNSDNSHSDSHGGDH